MRDAIFKGCTRPAMLWGVPLLPLVCVCGACLLAGVWGSLVAGIRAFLAVAVVLAPILVLLRAVTRHDDQRLAQCLLRLRMGLWIGALGHWRSRSYTPIRYRRLR